MNLIGRWGEKVNLYVTDLDGTLLNREGELSETSRKGLLRLIEQDVQVTVASARSVASMQNILRDIPLKLPVVAFNGSYVSSLETGAHYIVNAINKKTANSLFEQLKAYGVLTSLHYHGKDRLVYSGSLSMGARRYIDDRERQLKVQVDHLSTLNSKDDIMAFTVIDHRKKIKKLQESLSSYEDIIIDSWQDMYYEPWFWMSIHSKRSTKANGIHALQHLINKEEDKIIVFGDNTNDIEMFKMSDKSYAVNNAVDELKTYASDVIGHHSDDSVIKKIADLEGITFDII